MFSTIISILSLVLSAPFANDEAPAPRAESAAPVVITISAPASISIPANSSTIITVTATDSNGNHYPLTWSINPSSMGGVDQDTDPDKFDVRAYNWTGEFEITWDCTSGECTGSSTVVTVY